MINQVCLMDDTNGANAIAESHHDVSNSSHHEQETNGNKSNGDLRFNFNVHKPLQYTKSTPSFVKDERLHFLRDEGRRSRSQSEPLTREAVKIAEELRRASDLFNTSYEASSPTRRASFKKREKSRRITVGGSAGESLRQEVNEAIRANSGSFPGYNPVPPEGTPV